MFAARHAMYPENQEAGVLIEGTETRLQLEGNPPKDDDLASMVRQLTEKIGAGTLSSGVIAFNRYCSWVTHD